MGLVPFRRLARFALALFLALGPALAAEAGTGPRAAPRAPSEDLEDESPTEFAAPSARQRAAPTKRAAQWCASPPNLRPSATGAPKRPRSSSCRISLDPLGSRLRC